MNVQFSGGVLVRKMTEPLHTGDAREGYAKVRASLALQEQVNRLAETLKAEGIATDAESVIYSQPNAEDDQMVDTFYLVATDEDASLVRQAKETNLKLAAQNPVNVAAVNQADAQLKALAKQIYELALGNQA